MTCRFGLIACVFAGLLSLSNGTVRADTPDQIKKGQEMLKYRAPFGTPRCEGNVQVELGGIQMVVPRASSFVGPDGEDIREDLRHPIYNCSITHLTGLLEISANDTQIFAPRKIDPKDVARKIEKLKTARTLGQTTKLPSGAEKIDAPGMLLYVLPLDQTPTGDGQPVVFECFGRKGHAFNTDFCNVSYRLPNYIGIRYLIKWKHDDSTEFLHLDKEKRAFIGTAIAKAKQLTVPGEHKSN